MIQRDYLIVGAGVAAASVCESIRKYDKKKSIMLVGAEPHLPYDKPLLFPAYLNGKTLQAPQKLFRLSLDWYQKNKIDTRLDTIVTALNIERRMAVLANGQAIEFQKACLAMGSRPRKPVVAGANLGNVIYLRSMKDVMALREVIDTENEIIIIGGGYIAAETAALLSQMKKKVTLMCRYPVVWRKCLDQATAEWLTRYFDLHGVHMMMNETLNGFEGKTILRNIQTKSGNRFPAGVALVACGADPNLALVQNTPLSSPNGTPVNEYLETEEKGIYAVGDIALYPDRIFGGVRRNDHWESAVEQGHVAGANITGKKRQKFEYVPHHSSKVFDLKFDFIGLFNNPPIRMKLEGDYKKKNFVVEYYEGTKTTGIVLCNQTPARIEAARKRLRESYK